MQLFGVLISLRLVPDISSRKKSPINRQLVRTAPSILFMQIKGKKKQVLFPLIEIKETLYQLSDTSTVVGRFFT
jgi:hypothetical protein